MHGAIPKPKNVFKYACINTYRPCTPFRHGRINYIYIISSSLVGWWKILAPPLPVALFLDLFLPPTKNKQPHKSLRKEHPYPSPSSPLPSERMEEGVKQLPPLLALPNEVVALICEGLGMKEVCALSLTCKTLYPALQRDDYVWRELCRRPWPDYLPVHAHEKEDGDNPTLLEVAGAVDLTQLRDLPRLTAAGEKKTWREVAESRTPLSLSPPSLRLDINCFHALPSPHLFPLPSSPIVTSILLR